MAEQGLIVRIGADIGDFVSDFAKAGDVTENFGERARGTVNDLGKLAAACAAAGAAMVAHLVREGMEAVDVQADLAKQLNTTYDSLTSLRIAAGDVGVPVEALNAASAKLNKRLGEAANGSDDAKEAFAQLGLSASELLNMGADERLQAIGERIKELGLSSAQAAALLKDFGIRGTEITNILMDGGAAIANARKEVNELGLSLSQMDVEKIQQANDQFDRIALVMEGVRNKVTAAVAPIIGELADRFTQAAKESNGFGDIVTDSMEKVALAIGFVADAFHGAHVVVKLFETGFSAVGEGFWRTLQFMMEGVTQWVDTIASGVNLAIDAFNALTNSDVVHVDLMTDSPFMQGLRNIASEATAVREKTVEELQTLAMAEMPSEGITAFFDAVRARADETAASVTAVNEALGVSAETDSVWLEQLMKKQEEEREMTAFHQETLKGMEQSFTDSITAIRFQGLSAINSFTGSSMGAQVATVAKNMAQMTQGVARESRAMFEINKVAGIANAIVNTAQGISNALSAYPPPLSFAMAALQAAAGFAQVNAIKNAQFGSGGGVAPSAVGSTAAPPVSPVGGGGQASGGTLMVEGLNAGDMFSGAAVRELAMKLSDHVRDGGTVKII